MDYEKKYKEALKRARAINNGETTGALGETVCEFIFPELKESEDEKIRKTLIRFHKSTIDIDGIKGEDIIAWLENLNLIKANSPQLGEQKPTDKVEPKFKVGDKIHCKLDDRTFIIKEVDLENGTYLYTENGRGNDIDYADEMYELVE